MSGTRARVLRLLIAAAIGVPSIVVSFSSPSVAAPSAAEVASAKARLDQLNHAFEVAVERYNGAQVRLQATQDRLAEAKQTMDSAQAKARRARDALSTRAVSAYTGMGSQLDAILGSGSLTEFSDRLEFMGALAQSDAELAARADAASQEAQWAAQEYAKVLDEQRATLRAVMSERDHIEGLLNQAQALYEQMSQQRQAYLQALAAQRAAAAAQTSSPPEPPPVAPPPPGDASKASVAIQAAESVIGTQYVFGAADPAVGFDCSGLTMWAYAQAGVSLPHSAAAQYAVLPHVALSDIQPGDLLFFYSPISHVALYIGGGQMIHARHPGPGGQVQITALSNYDPPVAAARPT
ncbi:MAG: NlpC/P60 family protein [Planctomycetaceae bacterium]